MRPATTAAPASRIVALSHEISKSGRFSLWSWPMNRSRAFPLICRPRAKNIERSRTTDQPASSPKSTLCRICQA